MGRVLITGMSAVGKSTVLGELAGRGHQVVDADSDGYVDEHRVAGQADPEPLLREGRLSRLLDGHRDGQLFVAGTAANQGAFYARFDAIVLLTAPLDVITQRLARRTTNDERLRQDGTRARSDRPRCRHVRAGPAPERDARDRHPPAGERGRRHRRVARRRSGA